MNERVAFMDGRYQPEATASVSIFDRSFNAGDGVYDVARTFKHRPNKLREHCERLCRSAAYVRIPLHYSAVELETFCREVLRANCATIDENDDLMLWMVVSRGMDPPSRNPVDASVPTVVIHTLPINYARYVRSYAEGANLLTSSTRRTPPECLDPRAKVTNKMNHILAELEVKAVDKDAIPLMLGTDGTVAESSWANVFFVQGGDIYTPQPKNILLGIMRDNVLEVAAKAGIRITEGTYFPYDLSLADEIFLSSTTCCVLPVGRFNGRRLTAAPGPVTKALMAAWVDEVGLDFVAQARSLAKS